MKDRRFTKDFAEQYCVVSRAELVELVECYLAVNNPDEGTLIGDVDLEKYEAEAAHEVANCYDKLWDWIQMYNEENPLNED